MRMCRSRNICIVVGLVLVIVVTYVVVIGVSGRRTTAGHGNDDDEYGTRRKSGSVENLLEGLGVEAGVGSSAGVKEMSRGAGRSRGGGSAVDKKALRDVRSEQCRGVSYPIASGQKVVLVVDFVSFNVVDVEKLTTSVGGLLDTDVGGLVDRVAIVTRKSKTVIGDQSAVVDAMRKYLSSAHPSVGIRVVQIGLSAGAATARTAALKTTGAGKADDIIVFVDAATVVASVGWLEPLVDALRKNPNAIVAPHFDEIAPSNATPSLLPPTPEYRTTASRLTAEFAWPFKIRMTAEYDVAPNADGFLPSSALRGNAFAVTRRFWTTIGGYAPTLSDVRGATLELSLRTWMCGGGGDDGDSGRILIVPCSRVGVENLFNVVRVSNRLHALGVSETWYGIRREAVLRLTGLRMDDDVKLATEGLSLWVEKLAMTCKDFEWYLKTAATRAVVPSAEASNFGRLVASSGNMH